jgi:copper oxidase (laccase) domain-containing protein
VRTVFIESDSTAADCFQPTRRERWLMDIYALARQRLQRQGVESIYGGEYCTFTDPERFFSYRRDGVTGRMASVIWFEE